MLTYFNNMYAMISQEINIILSYYMNLLCRYEIV